MTLHPFEAPLSIVAPSSTGARTRRFHRRAGPPSIPLQHRPRLEHLLRERQHCIGTVEASVYLEDVVGLDVASHRVRQPVGRETVDVRNVAVAEAQMATPLTVASIGIRLRIVCSVLWPAITKHGKR